jgi:hypothetical protein
MHDINDFDKMPNIFSSDNPIKRNINNPNPNNTKPFRREKRPKATYTLFNSPPVIIDIRLVTIVVIYRMRRISCFSKIFAKLEIGLIIKLINSLKLRI